VQSVRQRGEQAGGVPRAGAAADFECAHHGVRTYVYTYSKSSSIRGGGSQEERRGKGDPPLYLTLAKLKEETTAAAAEAEAAEAAHLDDSRDMGSGNLSEWSDAVGPTAAAVVSIYISWSECMHFVRPYSLLL
jgi:hypothetical protein